MGSATVQDRARAALEVRRREEKDRLWSRYDWYGDECECGLPLGECREHPRARPNQRPPGSYRASSPREDWDAWLIEAGRGFGKTRAGAEYVRFMVESGEWMHVALVNETVKDVRDVQIEGPGGLLAIAPPWARPIYEPSKARVTWPNGAVATIYSAEQPGLLRGPQFHGGWCDEPSKWKHNQQETLDMLQFGLRMGEHPRAVYTTTPLPTEAYKALRSNPKTAITKGSTFENAKHLAQGFLRAIRERYEGTRLGRQELLAELLEDTPGALWTTAMIDGPRLARLPSGVVLVKVISGVDPGAGGNDPESSAETGIIVAAKGSDGRGYVLADRSRKGSPEEWAQAAIDSYRDHQGDRIAAEVNNGGDMVAAVLRAIDPNIPFTKLWASRGKVTRAEPVAALYEQGKVSHVGCFPILEAQMCGWVPGQKSPDRMDALVWALTEAVLDGAGPMEEGTNPAAGYRGRTW